MIEPWVYIAAVCIAFLTGCCFGYAIRWAYSDEYSEVHSK